MGRVEIGESGEHAPGAAPVRVVRLPAPAPPRLEPLSRVQAGFFRSVDFYARIGILGAVAVAVVGVLAVRLASLEVLRKPLPLPVLLHQATETVPVPGARGAIVDAKGCLLAGTAPRLVVAADASALGRVRGGVWRPSRAGTAVLASFARVAGGSVASFTASIRRSLGRSPFASAALLPASSLLADYLDEHHTDFPGLRVVSLPVRSYPQGALGAEFLGLLGEVSAKQLKDGAHGGYRAGQMLGQSGVEASYDRMLQGGLQRESVILNGAGWPVRPARQLAPRRPPAGLKLTIDARLQRAAAKAIRDGIGLAHAAGYADADAGAAVVMNPHTGAVYALASYPTFNQVAAAGDQRYLSRLLAGQRPALLDRATQGLYPLGSTFKPVVAAAGLSAGLISPYSTIPCTGTFTVGSAVFRNVEAGVDASLTLPQALSTSCDTWFYRLGAMFYERGSLGIQTWAHMLGIGERTGIDPPGEAAGIVPTPAWLRKTFTQPWQRVWYEGNSVNLSIGQGYLVATPLQLAVAYSALANGGTVVRPHVAQSVLDPSGQVRRELRFPPRARLHIPDLWAIRQGLYSAAHEGTSAAVFASYPVPVDGKTGTAQVPSGSDDSWYASWAPAASPKVVVVVLIEHGGFGADAAAPAAREIYDSFFGLKGG